jgi:serine/threonine protein phosphatase PrpC
VIPADRSHLFVTADSHPGMSGKNNEDRYAVSAFRLSQEDPTPVVLAVLADGIGGHNAGEVAAETAVEIISQTVANGLISPAGFAAPASNASRPLALLREAIIQASQTILELSETDDPEITSAARKGMGSTCACCLIIGGKDDRENQLYIAYAGDSRIYLLRNNTIQQLSIDHTWIQEALNAGVLTPEQARGHPNAHVIHRYLGSRQPVEPDTRLRLQNTDTNEQAQANQGMSLLPNDQLVICSDGLTDLVADDEILAVFLRKSQKEAIASLIHLANKRGGHDNITIVALRVPAKVSQTKPLPAPAKSDQTRIKQVYFTRWKWACLGGTIVTLIIGVMILATLYFLLPGGKNPGFLHPSTTVPPSPTLNTGLPIETATPLPEDNLTPTGTMPPASLPFPTPPAASPTPTFTPWPTIPPP